MLSNPLRNVNDFAPISDSQNRRACSIIRSMTEPTTSPRVSQVLYLLDRAFDGMEWHSLLGNLKSVTPDDWLWVPPGGRRSIRDIVQHIGAAKFIYHHYAFGDATLHWDDPQVDRWDVVETIPSAIDWLRENHSRLRESISALDDAGLLQPRPNFRGQLKETRWLIATMIEHDLYHAGEINHTRCLHQQDDE